jgi:molybdate transport system permease protein
VPKRRVPGARGAAALIAAPAVIGFAFLMLPLAALLIRAPWRGLGALLSDSQVLAALRLSIVYATAATVASLILGVPLA